MAEPTRRSRILEVAARLVVHYGPAKTTVIDIAREAGVSVGAVYLEFPSKEQIVLALAGGRYERVLDAMRVALAAPGPVPQRLRRAFDARLAVFLEACDEGTHGSELVACTSSPVRKAEQLYLQEERALVEGVLAEAVKKGELAVADPSRAAAALLRCYVSFRPPALRSCDREGLKAAIDDVHELVCHGLLGPSRGS